MFRLKFHQARHQKPGQKVPSLRLFNVHNIRPLCNFLSNYHLDRIPRQGVPIRERRQSMVLLALPSGIRLDSFPILCDREHAKQKLHEDQKPATLDDVR